MTGRSGQETSGKPDIVIIGAGFAGLDRQNHRCLLLLLYRADWLVARGHRPYPLPDRGEELGRVSLSWNPLALSPVCHRRIYCGDPANCQAPEQAWDWIAGTSLARTSK
jgi:hypothetical protein